MHHRTSQLLLIRCLLQSPPRDRLKLLEDILLLCHNQSWLCVCNQFQRNLHLLPSQTTVVPSAPSASGNRQSYTMPPREHMSAETRQMCWSISVHVSSNVFELEGYEGVLYRYSYLLIMILIYTLFYFRNEHG